MDGQQSARHCGMLPRIATPREERVRQIQTTRKSRRPGGRRTDGDRPLPPQARGAARDAAVDRGRTANALKGEVGRDRQSPTGQLAANHLRPAISPPTARRSNRRTSNPPKTPPPSPRERAASNDHQAPFRAYLDHTTDLPPTRPPSPPSPSRPSAHRPRGWAEGRGSSNVSRARETFELCGMPARPGWTRRRGSKRCNRTSTLEQAQYRRAHPVRPVAQRESSRSAEGNGEAETEKGWRRRGGMGGGGRGKTRTKGSARVGMTNQRGAARLATSADHICKRSNSAHFRLEASSRGPRSTTASSARGECRKGGAVDGTTTSPAAR